MATKPEPRKRTINGATYWEGYLGRDANGKARRVTRKRKADVEREIAKAWTARTAEGKDAITLSPAQRRDAARALGKLPDGVTLESVADYWLARQPSGGEGVTVRDLVGMLLASMEGRGVRERTITDKRGRLHSFVQAHGDAMAHTITATDIEAWLDSRGGGKTTRHNYQNAVSTLFRFAAERGLVQESPTKPLRLPRKDKPQRHILTVPECRRLMDTTARECPPLVPYMALCLFCGIRPEEATRLDWRDIDVEHREITIHEDVSKTDRERIVRMEEAAVAWIAPHARKSGRVHFSRDQFRRVREAAGMLEDWREDCMRHTAASMHLAAFRNAGDACEQMGHSLATFQRHYRRAVRQEDAEKFWQIMPGADRGKVLKLHA